MGASLNGGFNEPQDSPTVLWLCSEHGAQFGLDLDTIGRDLSFFGIRFVVVTDSIQASKVVMGAGKSLRCVVQNWKRSREDSGRRFIEQMHAQSGEARRHVPILVLSESVRRSQELQKQIMALGETVATFDPAKPGGYAMLLRWLVQRCIGIEKEALFVRHAEAEHNATENYDLPDPALTERGERQARELALDLPPEVASAQLIFSSPLRRTLQTTLLAFGGTSLPVRCEASLQELGSNRCDVGSDIATLRRWFAHERRLSFDNLDSEWYVKEGINRTKRAQERLTLFTGLLRQRPETKFIIVSHGQALAALLGIGVRGQHGLSGLSYESLSSFANCECRPYWLLSTGAWLPAPPADMSAPAVY